MNQFERRFLQKMGDQYLAATPGICISAFHRGAKILDVRIGQTYRYYDLASLTKILFTASHLMMSFDQKRFALGDSVATRLAWFPKNHPATIRDLLCHSAGLTWWYPFYKKVFPKTTQRTSPEAAWNIFEKTLQRQIKIDFKSAPTGPVKTVYSDLDLFVLGAIMQTLSEKSLYQLWTQTADRMGLLQTDFHRGNRPLHDLKNYAPTEDDRVWRKKVLIGEVHDQNTWALKGVAPHAGLFGSMSDLNRWGLLLRQTMRGEKTSKFASPETVKLFTTRAIHKNQGDWALDFMMPSRKAPSCGRLFSARSVGHLGFTGTSLWYDPKRDLLVNVLSNRIHPSVENIEIRKLRPRLHTWIAEQL